MFEQSYDFTFEAAHTLAHTVADNAEHPYARIHGHSFFCQVTLRSKELQPEGWVVDFEFFKSVCHRLQERLDHRFLNELDGFEQSPTMERLAEWIALQIQQDIPTLYSVTLSRPSLQEKVSYYAV